MSPKAQSVPDFLAALAHPQTALINQIRELVAEAGPELVEGIKWNAPSYALAGNDIITFNFRTFTSVALIFHTGPKGKDTHTGTKMFDDGFSLIQWLADKRFVIAITDAGYLESHRADLVATIERWIDHAKKGFQ